MDLASAAVSGSHWSYWSTCFLITSSLYEEPEMDPIKLKGFPFHSCFECSINWSGQLLSSKSLWDHLFFYFLFLPFFSPVLVFVWKSLKCRELWWGNFRGHLEQNVITMFRQDNSSFLFQFWFQVHSILRKTLAQRSNLFRHMAVLKERQNKT